MARRLITVFLLGITAAVAYGVWSLIPRSNPTVPTLTVWSTTSPPAGDSDHNEGDPDGDDSASPVEPDVPETPKDSGPPAEPETKTTLPTETPVAAQIQTPAPKPAPAPPVADDRDVRTVEVNPETEAPRVEAGSTPAADEPKPPAPAPLPVSNLSGPTNEGPPDLSPAVSPTPFEPSAPSKIAQVLGNLIPSPPAERTESPTPAPERKTPPGPTAETPLGHEDPPLPPEPPILTNAAQVPKVTPRGATLAPSPGSPLAGVAVPAETPRSAAPIKAVLDPPPTLPDLVPLKPAIVEEPRSPAGPQPTQAAPAPPAPPAETTPDPAPGASPPPPQASPEPAPTANPAPTPLPGPPVEPSPGPERAPNPSAGPDEPVAGPAAPLEAGPKPEPPSAPSVPSPMPLATEPVKAPSSNDLPIPVNEGQPLPLPFPEMDAEPKASKPPATEPAPTTVEEPKSAPNSEPTPVTPGEIVVEPSAPPAVAPETAPPTDPPAPPESAPPPMPTVDMPPTAPTQAEPIAEPTAKPETQPSALPETMPEPIHRNDNPTPPSETPTPKASPDPFPSPEAASPTPIPAEPPAVSLPSAEPQSAPAPKAPEPSDAAIVAMLNAPVREPAPLPAPPPAPPKDVPPRAADDAIAAKLAAPPVRTESEPEARGPAIETQGTVPTPNPAATQPPPEPNPAASQPPEMPPAEPAPMPPSLPRAKPLPPPQAETTAPPDLAPEPAPPTPSVPMPLPEVESAPPSMPEEMDSKAPSPPLESPNANTETYRPVPPAPPTSPAPQVAQEPPVLEPVPPVEQDPTEPVTPTQPPKADRTVRPTQDPGGPDPNEVNPLPPAREPGRPAASSGTEPSGLDTSVPTPAPVEGQPSPSAPVRPDPVAIPPSAAGNDAELTLDRLGAGRQEVALSVEVVAPQVVNLNQPVKIELRVRNGGPADAHGVQVVYRLPEGFELIDTEPKAQREGPSLVWALGKLAPDGRPTPLLVRARPVAVGPVDHAAIVRLTTGGRTRTLVQQPKLKVDLVANPVRVLKGQQVNFRIEVSNPGTGPVRKVVIQARFSAGLRHPAGSVIEYELDQVLEPGKSVRLKPLVVETIAAGAQTCEITASSSDVVKPSGNSTEPDEASRSAAVTVVEPQLKLAIDGPEKRFTDTTGTYHITVSNPGTAPAQDVQVEVSLPVGGELIAATNAQWDKINKRIYWTLPQLDERKEIRLPFQVRLAGIQLYQVAAQVRAGGGLFAKDTFSTDVTGIADVSFDIVEKLRALDVGDSTTYEIRIRNSGTKEATGLKLKARLSENLDVVDTSGTEENARFNPMSRELVFPPLPKLEPGRTVQLTIQVAATKPGAASCHATLTHDDLGDIPIDRSSVLRITANTRTPR